MRIKAKGAGGNIFFWERIAFRIALGFTLPVVVSAYALYSVTTVFSEVSETKERTQRTWGAIHLSDNRALLELAKMRMNALTYQYEGSPDLARQIDGEMREFTLDIGNSRKTLESIAAQNNAQLDITIAKTYSQVDTQHREFTQNVQRLLAAVRAKDAGEASSARKEVDRTARELESLIARLQAQNDRFENNISGRVQDDEERSSRTVGFYLVAVFLFGISAAVAVTVSITAPVRTVLNRIKDIATGDGDLTKRVATRVGGEMSELATWMNIFLDKTHGIISTIAHASATVHETTSQVGAYAGEMNVAASGISKNMVEQSMNIDECTSRVGSIDDLIQNAGESTRQAASLSKIAMDRALQGGASVHETIEAMEKIEETARKVEELLSSINEIASQTNLLAINAAIEATKAGDHGKGFAVVAEEVRKLAERARKLTGEVTGLVGESSGRVKAGVGLARAAGVSLDGIIKDVEAVVSLIQRIASASAKQTESSTIALEFMQKVSEGVRLNLEEMAAVTRATGSTTMEVSKLNALVSQLNEVVGQFRLDDQYRGSASEQPLYEEEKAAPPRSRPREQGADNFEINTRQDGELSLEAMMNPGNRPPELPASVHRLPPSRAPGFAPLPPGVTPSDEGDEDAA